MTSLRHPGGGRPARAAGVEATVAAATWRAPPARRARAASASVAPVVTTSSRTTQSAPRTRPRRAGASDERPGEVGRARGPAEPGLVEPPGACGAGRAAAGRPRGRGSRPPASSATGSSPRRRTAAAGGRDGHEEDRARRRARRRSTGSSARARTSATASSRASSGRRSARPPSLWAVTTARSGPSRTVADQQGGHPAVVPLPGTGRSPGGGPAPPAPPLPRRPAAPAAHRQHEAGGGPQPVAEPPDRTAHRPSVPRRRGPTVLRRGSCGRGGPPAPAGDDRVSRPRRRGRSRGRCRPTAAPTGRAAGPRG